MPSETHYDLEKKLEAAIARDRKIVRIACITAAVLLIALGIFLIHEL